MAILLTGTTIGGHSAIHAGNLATHGIVTTSNIGSYAITSIPANVITTSGGQTIAGTTYFSGGESLNVYGIRGRFTNEYMHLYNKVGIGHPSGWGQGEGNTPVYGLSTYGGINIAYAYDGSAIINTYTRINKNWGGGDYGTEAFTIRGTYPSITLRSTNHDSKWLIHHASELQFYYGASADNNVWANAFSIPTNGDIYMSWAGANISTLLNAKQNASTAITTSNIGSQTVSNSNHLNSTRDTPSGKLQYWDAPGLGIDEAPSGDWHNTIRMGHGSPLSYYSNTLAIRMTGSGVGDIYTQTIMNGNRQGWKKHWNDGNHGSGSGLDADLLDGQQGSYYQAASSAITTSNIGSQSVSYATTAGALTSMNISQFTNNSGYLTGITSGQVTGALGYTPYNSSNPSGYITSGDTTTGIFTTFLGNGTSNIGSGYTRVIRNENGAGGAPNYAPILHVAASDTMWQIAGAHAGQTTLVWRSGYSGAWNTPWWTIYHSGNFTDNSSNWNTAYSWGNHASAGYLTSLPSHNHDDRYYTESESDGRYAYKAGAAGQDFSVDKLSSYYLRNHYGVSTNHSYGMYFDNDLSTAYGIFRESGAWDHPYPDLRIAFHTGIKLGANSSYQGIRFYTDYDMTTQVMSVNNGSDGLGGGNVYVNNALQAGGSLRAPIFYDSNDTTYYLDPNSNSNLASVYQSNSYASNYFQVESGRSSGGFGGVALFRATRNAVTDFPSFSFVHQYGNHSWGQIARFHIEQSGADRPSIQFSNGSSNTRWNVGYCNPDDLFRISQNMGYRPDGSGVTDGWGTERFKIDTSGNTYAAIGGTLYANGSAVITSSNIGSQSVSYASTAGNSTTTSQRSFDYIYATSYLESAGAVYGTIFYDNNDRTYYVDPNGMSKQVQLTNLGTYGSNAANARNHFVQYNAGNAGIAGGWIAAAFGDATAARVVIGQSSSITEAIIGSHNGNLTDWGALGYVATTHKFYAPSWTSAVQLEVNTNGVYAPAYRGNANVGGTGSASWHPDGIYCGSTMWQYGAQYKNNTGIYGVSEIQLNAGLYLQTYNDRNLIVKGNSSSDAGIEGRNAAGNNVFQIYGSGSDYGFLNGTWAGWDIRKTKNAAMYMNNDSTYYLQTNSTSNFYALNIQGNAVVHAGNIGSQSVSYASSAGSVAWTNVSSRPTALSQFTNDLGNYGGFLTSITAHSHAISDVSGLQTALDGKQAAGSYAASSHTHDDRYYTESESDTRFARRDADSAISGNLVIGNGTYGNSTAYGSSGARLMFSGSDGDAQGNYYIGTNHNDYGGNYSKLELRWHTGIRMGAQPGYGGIRFYDTEDLGTVIFSVGTGDSHVRVVNNLYVGGNLALHAGNYNSYSPTLTGGNASGTWSINVTGSAGSVAWTNVSSRPTNLSQFTNDLGNYGGWQSASTAITTSNIGSQSVSYASTAGSAPANGGNSSTVGGYAPSGSVGANTVVIRDANNYIYAHYINSNVSESENPTINSFYTSNGDGWLRKSSVAHVKSQLGLGSMAYESSGTYQTVSGAINTGNIGSQSVSYATTSQQLTKFGDIYGQDWNSYYINGKMIVSSVYGGSGPNFPTGAYNYGAMLSYGVTGSDFFQVYFPENGALQGGAFRKLHYRTGWNGSWSAWKSVVDQEGQVCTIAGSNQTGIEIHSNVGYNQDPLTYFLMRGQADTSWKALKVRLTGDAGGQDIEFRRIAENGTDARMWYIPRGANTVNFDYPIVQPSDSRLKDNITPISTPVDKIKSLRGVEFDWNSGEQVGTHDVGLIAQDVEAVLPEAVTTQEDGYKNLAYTKVIPLLVEAMKEQQAMIEALKAEIELLKNK